LAIRFGEPKDSSGFVARGTPHTLSDVQHHQAIVGYRAGQPLSWSVGTGSGAYRFAPPATYEIGDGDAMIETTLAGLGLCQMPLPSVRDHIDAGRLQTVLDEFTPDLIDVHAVWPKSAHLRPKVRSVVDILVKLGSSGNLA
jgi:DNA-binding transcriptional LysR family regulator